MTANLLVALVLTAFALAIPLPTRQLHRVLILLAAVALCLLPWPWGIGGWVRSLGGDFSITTGMLALAALVRVFTGVSWYSRNEARGLFVTVLVAGGVFYGMAWVGDRQLWVLGFGNFHFSSALLLLGLLAWLLRAYFSCLVLAAAQLAFGTGLLPADNLWSYLVDPWLMLWCVGWLARDFLRPPSVPEAAAEDAGSR